MVALAARNCNLQQMRDPPGAGFRYIACMRRARLPSPTGAHKLPLQQENRSEKAHSVHRRRGARPGCRERRAGPRVDRGRHRYPGCAGIPRVRAAAARLLRTAASARVLRAGAGVLCAAAGGGRRLLRPSVLASRLRRLGPPRLLAPLTRRARRRPREAERRNARGRTLRRSSFRAPDAAWAARCAHAA
ncbi:hypothetical protein BVI434_950002 [Burkholderia vietnamiensis]|nr:hypothetical protein BVI434_950002 [Burkholderia vietnamiensis]